jgi:hypothetical protein
MTPMFDDGGHRPEHRSAEISRALHEDERLIPDLPAIRSAVLKARQHRRQRNRLLAGGLMAACVLVVTSAIALAALRLGGEQASGPGMIHDSVVNLDPSAGAAGGEKTTASAVARQPDAASPQPSEPAPPSTTQQSPPNSAAETTHVELTPGTSDSVAGRNAVQALQHCGGQTMAWPLAYHGAIDPVALRGAVNECSVGFGNGPRALAQYSVMPLSTVAAHSSLYRTGSAAAGDPNRPVLAIRMVGSFPELTDGSTVPTAVQIYLDTYNKSWFGIEFRHPVELRVFGTAVATLH